MHINWWTLALQTINVVVLVWLLGRFLFKPVMRAIAVRQAAAEKLLADAETAKAAALAQEGALKERNDQFDADTQRRRDEVRTSAEADRVKLFDRAREEAAVITAQAVATNAAERQRMDRELQDQAAALAGQMAEKLLRRIPVRDTTAGMFTALIDQLRSLPEEERRKLSEGALQFVTPAPLEPADQTRYARELSDFLPGLTTPEFVTDPTLIAGFELRSSGSLIRNSWRADLDAILARVREESNHVSAG